MLPSWLSLIDIAYIAIALLFALGGLQKGFASQVAHIITCTGMGLFLLFAYPFIFSYMGRLFRSLDAVYMMWILLIGIVVLTVFFYVFVNKLLASLLKTNISDRTDRIFGFHLGLVRGALLALLGMIFLVILGSERFHTVFSEKSNVGRFVCYQLVPRIQPRIPHRQEGDKFDRMRDALINQKEAGVIE